MGISTGNPRIAIMDVWLPLREVMAEIMVSVMARPMIPVIIDKRYELKFHGGTPFNTEKTAREIKESTSIKMIPYKSFER